ncbi:hypothetical protein CBA19CS11_29520 [Caballeronia novacaledonica]|uniref:hypothetical protein n=1 Tax=Caballeronia novacaledonica TaxID=1544861 RepID=UPI001EE1F808|nr:hypothetical protein [Caballeronia novacaledonica]GJH13064.1 hypothetical protein CBA19CS11_29520 [Caballeronia novacaledonica]
MGQPPLFVVPPACHASPRLKDYLPVLQFGEHGPPGCTAMPPTLVNVSSLIATPSGIPAAPRVRTICRR